MMTLSPSNQSPDNPNVVKGGPILKKITALNKFTPSVPFGVCNILRSLENNHTLEKLELAEDHDLTSDYNPDYFKQPVQQMKAQSVCEKSQTNLIGVKGGIKLDPFLRTNTTLKKLKLVMSLDKDTICDILHSLDDNRTLEKLELCAVL